MAGTPARAFVVRLFAKASTKLAGGTLLLLGLLAVSSGVIEMMLGVSSTTPDLTLRYADAAWPHLAGGDELGYDVFARLLHGARVSLVVAAVAMMVSTGIGLVVGVTAGALGGIVDAALMRFTDALLAIPLLPLLLIASALDLSAILPNGPAASVVRMIGILSLFSWMSIARLARASVLQANALDYVLAARALGASRWHIAKTHLLSAAAPPVVVAATLEVGNHLLAEAALSFLGLGIQPPVPSWGNMLSHGLDAIKVDAALMALPGACILLTVTCVHWLGDGLREALDPRGSRP